MVEVPAGQPHTGAQDEARTYQLCEESVHVLDEIIHLLGQGGGLAGRLDDEASGAPYSSHPPCPRQRKHALLAGRDSSLTLPGLHGTVVASPSRQQPGLEGCVLARNNKQLGFGT